MFIIAQEKGKFLFFILFKIFSGECLLCYTNPRNTIYLPCKHSCCCKNCSHNLRMRNFPCPMCKNSKIFFIYKNLDINDILILEYEDLEVA